MQEIYIEHYNELSHYPLVYTLQMAQNNKDIITYGAASYNVKRLDKFINNVRNKLPDKVVITNYGIDLEYPHISILQYNGEFIIYTQRSFNEDKFKYDSFYGNEMMINIRDTGYSIIKDYILNTIDGFNLFVFHD
jgi:hypothetical protein